MLPFPVCHWGGGRFASNGFGAGASAFVRRTGGLSGIADSKSGTLAFWAKLNRHGQCLHFRKSSGGTAGISIIVDGPGFGIFRLKDTNNQRVITGTIGPYPDVDVPANREWAWYGWSWDSGASRMAARYNDTDVDEGSTIYDTNKLVALAGLDCSLYGSTTAASADLLGCFAYVFFSTTEYDFNQESNRRLFIDSGGNPVETFPSGGIIQSELGDIQPNEGSGGAFTVIDPPFVKCADSP